MGTWAPRAHPTALLPAMRTVSHARQRMNTSRYWNWRIAVIAFIAAPSSVLLHELAHVGALELGGVAAQLRGFSMGTPADFFWNFEGLEDAKRNQKSQTRLKIRATHDS